MQADASSLTNRRGVVVSVVVHAVVMAAVVGVLHRTVEIAPYRFPGTEQGVRLLTYYAPGSIRRAQSDVPAKVVEEQAPKMVVHTKAAVAIPEKSAAASADPGAGTASSSGLGEGNIRIALQKYFPYPKPSLSTLPHGTAGDVILHVVIDEHGKITELTLLQGLGPAIDDEVIETVNQWTYTPATKDGVPVPSVEELHFHYERRG
jgi:periplasmic protein TonB